MRSKPSLVITTGNGRRDNSSRSRYCGRCTDAGHMLAGVNKKESECLSDAFVGNIYCYYMKSSYTAHTVYLLVYNAAVHDVAVVCVCVCVCVGGWGESGEYKMRITAPSTHTYTENYMLMSLKL